MVGAFDFGGLAAVLMGLSAVLGGVNAVLNTLIHRRAKRVEKQATTLVDQLNRHYERVQGSYETMAQEARALTAYIQGLNTERAKGER